MNKRKALIVANGHIEKDIIFDNLKKEYGFNSSFMVICADGGYKNAKSIGLEADIVIGDLDSIDKKEYGVKYISYSKDKDESDTQLALEFALKSKMEQVILIGGLGDRQDHGIANIFLLAHPKAKKSDFRILEYNCEISLIAESKMIVGCTGQTISFFSLEPYTYIESTEGLKYPMKQEKLLFSPVRGLSNILTEDSAKIEIGKGCLLVIRNF